MMNAETLPLEVEYKSSHIAGVVNVFCNREPTAYEMQGLREGLSLGCEIGFITFPEEKKAEEQKIISGFCCGKLMKISQARRDPFTDAINHNIGKPWCSMCGRFET